MKCKICFLEKIRTHFKMLSAEHFTQTASKALMHLRCIEYVGPYRSSNKSHWKASLVDP